MTRFETWDQYCDFLEETIKESNKRIRDQYDK